MSLFTLLFLSVVLPGPSEALPPTVIATRGDFVHPTAGVPFPERVAEFVRGDVVRFDREGRDIAATYNWTGSRHRLWATVYVYPVGSETRDLQEKFARARAAVEERAGVVLLGDAEVTLAEGRLTGRVASFSVQQRQGEEAQQSYLFLFRWNDWWVKWRITYPASGDDAGLPAAVRLVEALTPSEGQSARILR